MSVYGGSGGFILTLINSGILEGSRGGGGEGGRRWEFYAVLFELCFFS